MVAAIQVKARSPQTRPWIMLGSTIPKPAVEGGNEWFVLVSLHGAGVRPDFHVVPRNHVVALAHCDTCEWHSHPRRDGQPRTTRRVVIKLADVSRDTQQAPWIC